MIIQHFDRELDLNDDDVAHAVKQLPYAERLLMFALLMGWSVSEWAEQTGQTRAQADHQKRRAMARMKKMLITPEYRYEAVEERLYMELDQLNRVA